MDTKRIRRIAVAAAVVLALTAGAGAAVTAQAGGSNAPGAPAAPTARAGPLAPAESGFVAMVPCRLFSTVPVGGKFNPGETRSINKGGNLATQGGKAGGCGIPDDATALHVTVTAVLAEGNGFIRVWPDASVEQPATFMNFSNSFNVSSSGTLDVDTGGGIDVMDLKVNGARTHVIIDVLGYYVEPMIAVVSGAGALVRGTAGAAVVRQGTGSYRVEFDRNVQGCTLGTVLGSTAGGFPPTGGTAMAGFSDTAVQTDVYVETRNAAGAMTDLPFHLTVTC
jgi:hypothetical protein